MPRSWSRPSRRPHPSRRPISYDDVTLPFPEAVDAASLTEVIGPVEELPFPQGVADAVERFRRLLADGRVAA